MRASVSLLLAVGAFAFSAVSAQGPLRGDQLPGPFGGAPNVPRDAREEPTGTATITGRVLAADSGTPIRRAQVRAVSTSTRASRIVSTDGDGRFELRDLPAGRWELTASKAGFVTLRYGQRRPFEAGRPIELKDAQKMDRVDISLPRGGAITGRVFDEFGDPVAGARLQVLRYQFAQGERRLAQTGIGDQSDDTGAFRLYGLTPGDYYVSASVRALPVDDPTRESAGYAPTYFPGTGNVAEAQRVTLAVGQEVGNINFALLPVRTVRVSGSVIDSMGRPLAGGFLLLASQDGVNGPVPGLGNGGGVRPDGSFTLANVAPGAYTLTVAQRGGGGRRGGGPLDSDGEIASLPITVGNEDLTGVSIVTTKGATLSGTVVAAPGSTATLSTTGIQIAAQGGIGGRGIGARPARVESNGTFTLTGLLGPRTIRVNGLPQEWMLQSITIDTTDITDRRVEFGGNQSISGVKVTVTDRVTEVNGSVREDSQSARDYTVVVFPDDNEKWTAPSRYVRTSRPDQQGMFKIRGLPTEDRYLAVAVDYLEEGEGSDPQFLDQMKASATRFGLGDGDTKVLELRLVQR